MSVQCNICKKSLDRTGEQQPVILKCCEKDYCENCAQKENCPSCNSIIGKPKDEKVETEEKPKPIEVDNPNEPEPFDDPNMVNWARGEKKWSSPILEDADYYWARHLTFNGNQNYLYFVATESIITQVEVKTGKFTNVITVNTHHVGYTKAVVYDETTDCVYVATGRPIFSSQLPFLLMYRAVDMENTQNDKFEVVANIECDEDAILSHYIDHTEDDTRGKDKPLVWFVSRYNLYMTEENKEGLLPPLMGKIKTEYPDGEKKDDTESEEIGNEDKCHMEDLVVDKNFVYICYEDKIRVLDKVRILKDKKDVQTLRLMPLPKFSCAWKIAWDSKTFVIADCDTTDLVIMKAEDKEIKIIEGEPKKTFDELEKKIRKFRVSEKPRGVALDINRRILYVFYCDGGENNDFYIEGYQC